MRVVLSALLLTSRRIPLFIREVQHPEWHRHNYSFGKLMQKINVSYIVIYPFWLRLCFECSNVIQEVDRGECGTDVPSTTICFNEYALMQQTETETLIFFRLPTAPTDRVPHQTLFLFSTVGYVFMALTLPAVFILSCCFPHLGRLFGYVPPPNDKSSIQPSENRRDRSYLFCQLLREQLRLFFAFTLSFLSVLLVTSVIKQWWVKEND